MLVSLVGEHMMCKLVGKWRPIFLRLDRSKMVIHVNRSVNLCSSKATENESFSARSHHNIHYRSHLSVQELDHNYSWT